VYGQAIFLTRQSTRPSVLLPFHLMWFGGLSKRQGAIALQKGLIVPGLLNKSARADSAINEPRATRSRRHLGSRRTEYSTRLCTAFEGMGARHRGSLLHLRKDPIARDLEAQEKRRMTVRQA
jgi:hypothetical protein